jgi:hypothetical protein
MHPEDYGITALPAGPEVHGWLAISVTRLLYRSSAPDGTLVEPWARLRDVAPDARAGSIFLYHVP